MLYSKIDSVTIGNNFEQLIEKKHQIEKQNRKELSKERNALWNVRKEREKYCEIEIKNIEIQRDEKLTNLHKEYEDNKKNLALQSLKKIKDLHEKKEALSHTFTSDLQELRNKFELLLKKKNGELFEKSHLHVIGYPENITVDDVVKL